jgi:hypothetical protein
MRRTRFQFAGCVVNVVSVIDFMTFLDPSPVALKSLVESVRLSQSSGIEHLHPHLESPLAAANLPSPAVLPIQLSPRTTASASRCFLALSNLKATKCHMYFTTNVFLSCIVRDGSLFERTPLRVYMDSHLRIIRLASKSRAIGAHLCAASSCVTPDPITRRRTQLPYIALLYTRRLFLIDEAFPRESVHDAIQKPNTINHFGRLLERDN